MRPPARNLPVARTLFCNQAAVTGWAWTASGGPLFPGYISASEGITFESLGRVGYAAWDATPENGKFQILGVIGILELLGEASVKPHYMSGGTPGKIPLLWDPLGFTSKLSPEALARKRNSELKNGCAAAPFPTRMPTLPPPPRDCTPRARPRRPVAHPSRAPLAVQAPGDDWRCVARVRPLLPRLGPYAAGRHVSVQTNVVLVYLMRMQTPRQQGFSDAAASGGSHLCVVRCLRTVGFTQKGVSYGVQRRGNFFSAPPPRAGEKAGQL